MLRKDFEIVGAAFGLASNDKRTSKGPAVLRRAGLLDRLAKRGGGIAAICDGGDIGEPDDVIAEFNPKAKHLKELLNFSDKLIAKFRQVYRSGRVPILIGGDHSVSIASISAAAEFLREAQGASAELGVLWVDAHADINTPETSNSGNIHGMSLAHLLGQGAGELSNLCGFSPKLKAHNIVYIGLRDLDPAERDIIKKLEIPAYTMQEIDMLGIGQVFKQAVSYLADKTGGYVLSFDLDVCDPSIAPGVGVAVRGGLSYRESHLVMELAAKSDKLISIELVEFNPDLDKDGITADLAIGLLESAVGRSIL